MTWYTHFVFPTLGALVAVLAVHQPRSMPSGGTALSKTIQWPFGNSRMGPMGLKIRRLDVWGTDGFGVNMTSHAKLVLLIGRNPAPPGTWDAQNPLDNGIFIYHISRCRIFFHWTVWTYHTLLLALWRKLWNWWNGLRPADTPLAQTSNQRGTVSFAMRPGVTHESFKGLDLDKWNRSLKLISEPPKSHLISMGFYVKRLL